MQTVSSSGIEFLYNRRVSDTSALPGWLSADETRNAVRFLQTMDGYGATPLISLPRLAKEFGIAGILVKDESHRFGMNAFKCLGVAYAVARAICEKLGIPVERASFEYLKSKEVRSKIGRITFAAATDGNHGRAVAWMAQQLDQQAVIFLPKGSAQKRIEAIEKTGAHVIVTSLNYDDTVQMAKTKAMENGWELVQDTAWDGYSVIPRWIMQGYTAIFSELEQQIRHAGLPQPTHVVLQAGVGGMAGAMLGSWACAASGCHPYTIIVEPENAACIFHSVSVGDSKPHAVGGNLDTIMAGLACGDPNPVAWSILRDFADAYISCPDDVAARGIRILANPLEDDPAIVSGESGAAVGIGLLSILMKDPGLNTARGQLKLDQDSVVLLINTEGNTDPVRYMQILWDGDCPKP